MSLFIAKGLRSETIIVGIESHSDEQRTTKYLASAHFKRFHADAYDLVMHQKHSNASDVFSAILQKFKHHRLNTWECRISATDCNAIHEFIISIPEYTPLREHLNVLYKFLFL
jgi:hypothetical protein